MRLTSNKLELENLFDQFSQLYCSLPGLHSDLSLTSLDGEEGETLRRGALAAACADAVAAYAALEGSRVRDSIAAHARRALERERQIDEKNEIIADLSSKVSRRSHDNYLHVFPFGFVS